MQSTGGVSVQSGNASTLIYNIPHGLGVVYGYLWRYTFFYWSIRKPYSNSRCY